VVRVLDRHGFGTVEPGQLLVAGSTGETFGGVFLGALDEVAVPLARAARERPATRSGHVREDVAVTAGLACSGGATLLGHPLDAAAADALGSALAGGRVAALAATADGRAHLVLTGAHLDEAHGGLGDPAADAAVVERARRLLRMGATCTERLAEPEVLLDLWVPVPTVLVVGSGAIGDALLRQAALLGWSGEHLTGLDEARARVARFTEADVLVLLDHAGAFDALLADGLAAGRGFIGALGSRQTQAARRRRLEAAGLSASELARLHGRVGLDLGARTPAETAVSIVAEVISRRSGRAGAALAGTDGRIGA
jgi:xanthine dehydrogenase accessory factor